MKAEQERTRPEVGSWSAFTHLFATQQDVVARPAKHARLGRVAAHGDATPALL